MKELPPAEIVVLKGGWLTTVQDLGRYGYQHDGVSVSGAMDSFSTIVANRLVGNSDQAAVLECTLKGPELLFEQETVIAITGADLSPTVNGASVPTWQSFVISRGSRLSFGPPQSGCRAYLAIAGGIDVPLVLGSRSTHCASETGGLQGKPLQQGDALRGGNPGPFINRQIGAELPDALRPRYGHAATLHITPGPQVDCFGEQSIRMMTSSDYTVSPQSDRMGYRLAGTKIARKGLDQFISDGTAMGALQVPPDGQPILLMADRQTTGGYPKIAVVISGDLPFAAQLVPGDRIRFAQCSVAEARATMRRQRADLDAALPPHVQQLRSDGTRSQ
ncbi:MAG: biotin-dependent carboxyltransferase [Nitrospira sp.]|nr:biotin-dependent carboxyltransferase [Nitrospira sp.]